MNVVSGTLDAWQTVTIVGKLTIKNISIVRKYLEQAESTAIPGVVIDMSGVTQLDSSGITLLMNFQRRVGQKGGLVVIVGMPGDIAEIFSIVGIDKVFRICLNVDEFRRIYLA